ncbi:RHS repeat protein [bacterium]|nr:RHS repeat protein [bacterium]
MSTVKPKTNHHYAILYFFLIQIIFQILILHRAHAQGAPEYLLYGCVSLNGNVVVCGHSSAGGVGGELNPSCAGGGSDTCSAQGVINGLGGNVGVSYQKTNGGSVQLGANISGELWVRGTPSVTVTSQGQGQLDLSGTGYDGSAQLTFGSVPLSGESGEVNEAAGGQVDFTHLQGVSGSGARHVDVECGGGGRQTRTFSEYPGVTYLRVSEVGFSLGNFTRMDARPGEVLAVGSGSFSYGVELGASEPVVSVEGPLVGGNLNLNPPRGALVDFEASASDPDNQVGSGICSYEWEVRKPDGVVLAGSGEQLSFDANLSGEYRVEVEVTDNEGVVKREERVFFVGSKAREPQAGTGPNDEGEGGKPQYSNRCGGDEYVSVGVNPVYGNGYVAIIDPIATRGMWLRNDVWVSSQGLIKFPDHGTVFGNAAFTYGISVEAHVVQGVNGPEVRHFLFDADGYALEMGVDGHSPVRPPGMYSELSWDEEEGYELNGAGPPGEIFRAGDYRYEFNEFGHLERVVDPRGNVQELRYDVHGYQLERVDDLSTGKYIEYQYDEIGGLVSRVVEGSGSEAVVSHFSYDVEGRLGVIETKTAAGVRIRRVDISYDGFGRIFEVVKDEDQQTKATFSYQYYRSGFDLANVSFLDGKGSHYRYFDQPESGVGGGFDFRITETNEKGGVVSYDYTSASNLGRITYPEHEGSSVKPRYNFSQDVNHKRVSFSDGAVTWTYGYTAKGHLTSVVNSNSQEWTYLYSGSNEGNDLVEVSDGEGVLYTLEYEDPLQPHVVTKLSDSLGRVWGFGHNAYGQVTSVVPPVGSRTGASQYSYYEDTNSPFFGYIKEIVNGAGNRVSFDAYSVLGQPTMVSTYPRSGRVDTTKYSYDGTSRLLSMEHPGGKRFDYTYAGWELVNTVDEAGTIVNYEWCASCGKLTGVDYPLGKMLDWGLDTDGDYREFSDGRENLTTYTYGRALELKSAGYPQGMSTRYFYDAVGRVRQVRNGRNQNTDLTYDGGGRVSGVNYGGEGVVYGYRSDDLLETVTDHTGVTSYEYYLDRRVKVVRYNYVGLSAEQSLEYTYYPEGLVSGLVWKSGGNVVANFVYDYDAAGRLKSVVNLYNEKTSFSYDGEGKLLTVDRQNGVGTGYVYEENRDWVTTLQHGRGLYALSVGGTRSNFLAIAKPFANYRLEYDGGQNTVGQITKVTERDGTTVQYGYDGLYRLTSEVRSGASGYSKSYGYDLAGNVTHVNGSQFATYGGANLISTLSGGVVEQDNDGNINYLELPGGGVMFPTWSARSKMTNFGTYDGFGRRVKKGSRYYIYAGDKLLGEISGGAVDKVYTWGADGLVSQRLVGAGASYWYHFGPQGETRHLTNSSGNVVGTYTYDAYGKQITTTGGINNNFRYGGKYGYYYDEQVYGMYLAGARWYAPDLYRWMSRDPIEYSGGDNMFAYVAGNPVKYVDPSGLATYECKRPIGGKPGEDYFGPLYHTYMCVIDKNGAIQCGGTTAGSNPPGGIGIPYDIPITPGPGMKTTPGEDYFNEDSCEKIKGDNECFEFCVKKHWRLSRPDFAIGPMGTDCQEYNAHIIEICANACQK